MAESNVMYFYSINAIGGIEEFYYQLGQKYHDLDITIYYRIADAFQLNRLKKFFRCVKYEGQIIECDKAFFNFNLDIIDSVIAKEYICVLHGDYKDMVLRKQIDGPPTHPKITKYVGVSKLVCDSFTELTGIPCELSYNPYTIPKTQKKYRFILAQRFSKEKGQKRVLELISKLDVPFTMDIYTNQPFKVDNENVHFLKPRLDVDTLISKENYDFFVILSDNEGFCYGLIQALSKGVPVIATRLPVFKELGLNENNSIYFDEFDCEKLKKPFNYTFASPKDSWNTLFTNKKSTYEGVVMKKIQATSDYFDTQVKRNIKNGEIYEVEDERAKVIFEAGFCKILKDKNEKTNK